MKYSKRALWGLMGTGVLIVLVAVSAGYFFWAKPLKTPSLAPIRQNAIEGWQTYTNRERAFSFQYPKGWILKEHVATSTEGEIVVLVGPEADQIYTKRKRDPGYSYGFIVSFWPTINQAVNTGDDWIGKRPYVDLADFLTDERVSTQKTGTIMIDGQMAYEVLLGGAGQSYAVMIERDGIYELFFPTAWEKSALDSVQKKILSSFIFL
ncbi:hypothetical protein KBC59_02220 [Patescibacteria group bacterium]|jgi:hypothetical protein|nr:hypothetical protein [Patescibacteria group bacterium]